MIVENLLLLKEQVELCKKYKIELSEAELQVLPLIHAKLGAYLAKEKYEVDNERVINAILYHTTGRPNMSYAGQNHLFIGLY